MTPSLFALGSSVFAAVDAVPELLPPPQPISDNAQVAASNVAKIFFIVLLLYIYSPARCRAMNFCQDAFFFFVFR
jgi:hypothetical protein